MSEEEQEDTELQVADEQTITVPFDYFEHLLNCLANQKGLSTLAPSTIELANQEIIDIAWNEGMRLLTSTTEEDSEQEDTGYF